MRRIIFTFLFICTLVQLNAQVDNLYQTEIEETLFKRLQQNDTSYNHLAFLLAVDSLYDKNLHKLIQSEINNITTSLEQLNIHNKKPKKKVKAIFNYIHSNYLKIYEETAIFNDIFKHGAYNCVSASALYSIIFEVFDIPFQIKETPTHIYLVAYPTSFNILVESTNPNTGYYAPDERKKREFINELIQTKYLESSYVNKVGIDFAFNEFFFDKENIPLKKLAAIQYYNQFSLHFNSESYSKALNAIIKASILNPCDLYEYYEKITLGTLLDKSDYMKLNDIEMLIRYTNLTNEEYTFRYTKSILANLLSVQLMQNGKIEYIEQVYKLMNTKLNSIDLTSELEELYYVQLSIFYFKKFQAEKSFELAKKAYKINPDNLDLQNLIATHVHNLFSSKNANESLNSEIQKYIDKFPFLDENPSLKTIQAHNHAMLAIKFYTDNMYYQAVKHRHACELILDEYKPIVNEHIIGELYSAAGAYYVRQTKYIKAKNILDKGLLYSPNNFRINKTMSYVIDYISN